MRYQLYVIAEITGIPSAIIDGNLEDIFFRIINKVVVDNC